MNNLEKHSTVRKIIIPICNMVKSFYLPPLKNLPGARATMDLKHKYNFRFSTYSNSQQNKKLQNSFNKTNYEYYKELRNAHFR